MNRCQRPECQELLAAAMNLENDAGLIPQHAWDLLQEAIEAAGGKRKILGYLEKTRETQ